MTWSRDGPSAGGVKRALLSMSFTPFIYDHDRTIAKLHARDAGNKYTWCIGSRAAAQLNLSGPLAAERLMRYAAGKIDVDRWDTE